ncbi:hypothetical protein HanPSC8_Chr10g0449441 [Helianthus annuus]|nr:hypothetical protein HanPSC8_Chr10g0449441 [Helianthus annuus]
MAKYGCQITGNNLSNCAFFLYASKDSRKRRLHFFITTKKTELNTLMTIPIVFVTAIVSKMMRCKIILITPLIRF